MGLKSDIFFIFIMKDTPKASPARTISSVSISEIPIQEMALDVPLSIPGLANTDSYFNLSTGIKNMMCV